MVSVGRSRLVDTPISRALRGFLLKIPLEKRLNNPHVARFVLPNFDRAIIFQEGVGLHELLLRLRVRDHDLPPDLVLPIDSTECLINWPACLDIGRRVPNVDLAQEASDRGSSLLGT